MGNINLGYYTVPHETTGGVCVDVGCNLGDFTDKYKKHFKKIYFIEPQKQLFDNLITRFELDENIYGFNLAAWSISDIELELVGHSNNDHGSVGVKSELLNSDWGDNVVNKVKSVDINTLFGKINEKYIDYMKIDCENSEYEFLLNKDLSNIGYIGIELHNQMGIGKYTSLIDWIQVTHELVNGDLTYKVNWNNEVFFKNKIK
jgi:FkbM family methyltransferase